MSERKVPPGVVAEVTENGMLRMIVADGVVLTEPLMLPWSNGDGPGWELVLGKRSAITVVEELTGTLEKHSVSITLGDESSADIISLQALDVLSTCVIEQRGVSASGARVTWRNLSLGGKSVEHSLVSTLEGNDASSDVQWMFYGRERDRFKGTVRNVFLGKNGGGEILMKGVSEGHAQLTCNGMIEIGLHGGGTDTYLTQQVLMLDPTSKIDAIPGLEIKTNDVKASHSATVARLTPEDLFTFAARGIPEPEARRMFVEGFLGDLAAKMPAIAAGKSLQMIAQKYAATT